MVLTASDEQRWNEFIQKSTIFMFHLTNSSSEWLMQLISKRIILVDFQQPSYNVCAPTFGPPCISTLRWIYFFDPIVSSIFLSQSKPRMLWCNQRAYMSSLYWHIQWKDFVNLNRGSWRIRHLFSDTRSPLSNGVQLLPAPLYVGFLGLWGVWTRVLLGSGACSQDVRWGRVVWWGG